MIIIPIWCGALGGERLRRITEEYAERAAADALSSGVDRR